MFELNLFSKKSKQRNKTIAETLECVPEFRSSNKRGQIWWVQKYS